MTSAVLDNVTISYDRHPAVHHINGTFANGSLTAIAGPNGAGKSTLLKAIAGILPPDEGHITIEGTDKRLAYMPQASGIQRDFPLTALHMVATGAWHRTGSFGVMNNSIREQAAQALATVGLRGLEKRNLSTLSAGQFQRALFARLVVQDAPIILLDEPFTAIDAETTAQLMEIVLRWHKEGRTVICVLHDFEQIRQYFPQCLLMARECIAWGDSAKVLSPEYLLTTRFFRDGWNANPALCERAV